MVKLTQRQESVLFQAKLQDLKDSGDFDFDEATRALEEFMKEIATRREEQIIIEASRYRPSK